MRLLELGQLTEGPFPDTFTAISISEYDTL